MRFVFADAVIKEEYKMCFVHALTVSDWMSVTKTLALWGPVHRCGREAAIIVNVVVIANGSS